MSIQERPLDLEEANEIQALSVETLGNLEILPSANPDAIVQKVDSFVDQWQTEPDSFFKKYFTHKPDPIDVALGLGIVWGNQLVRQFSWEWVCIQDDGQDWYGVVSPNRSLIIYPTYFIKACLDDSSIDCTAMLSFNMLAANDFSDLPENGYENFMQSVYRIIPKR
ncbi:MULTISPECIES: hypothetical protein [Kamptonema]|uniref:hypothetical protein n=1 Tax=Kamptonema TaxID=1501433 RepID=UPI0001DAC4C8|nr:MULTISPECIES: hypothetical protein [Kamptonema]CBN59064.1 hypothetical protein OSCI_4010014 [Kamptonema sp. PCC 6506]